MFVSRFWPSSRDSFRMATRKLSFAATWMNRRLFNEVILACHRSRKQCLKIELDYMFHESQRRHP